MKSRENFVLQVKRKIVNEHGKDDKASFILGLSGKWGEGKTKFLIDLSVELEKKGFEKPIWVSPWKYGDDRVSFLRNFLKDVSLYSQKVWHERLRDWLNNRDDFRELYNDTSKAQVHRGWAVFLFLLLLNILTVYFLLLPQLEVLFSGPTTVLKKYYSIISGLIILPFLIPLLNSFLTIQQSNKAVSTIDKFDELLNKLIERARNKKIVVFIDDLDRVTPEVARSVIDNMRIFFDKPELTFVVTGDHTVLERYIGVLTIPKATLELQLEEGRRYLKKVFNLYWRLPLPLGSEFDDFLNKLFESKKTQLDKIFKEIKDVEKFKKYLAKYFEKNFRQVIRFFDTVLFTFDIVKTQNNTAGVNIKQYYKQMLENPLLVIRILMIQELCMPLFDAIAKDTGELRALEYLVEKKSSEEIEKKLQDYGSFTPGQLTFIRQFLYEEPRFFKDKILQVSAFEPFLYLAADANLGDARGSTKEDFIETLKSGDPDQVVNSLQNSGEMLVKQAAIGAVELLKIRTEPPVEPAVNGGYIRTIVVALTKIPDHFSQPYFIQELKSIDYTKLFSDPQFTNRLQISQEFWKWLDSQPSNDAIQSYLDFFPALALEDLAKIDFSGSMGYFSSRVISRWLKTLYPANKDVVLGHMEVILPKLNRIAVNQEYEPELTVLIQDVFSLGTEDQREKLYQLLMEYISSAGDQLKIHVFEGIKNQYEPIWLWASQKTIDKYKPWSREELELEVVKNLDMVTDAGQLVSLIRYAGTKITNNASFFWEEVVNKHSNKVDEIVAQLSNDSLLTFSPPQKIAKIFFESIMQRIERGDDSQKVLFLPILENKWIWSKIPNLPGYRRLKKIGFSANSELLNRINSVLQSWRKDPIIIGGSANTSDMPNPI